MSNPLVNPYLLREIRGRLDSSRSCTCDIQTDVGILVSGGKRPSWQATGAARGVPCFIAAIGGSRQNTQDQQQPQEMWAVHFPVGTVVTEANRLVVTGRDLVSGAQFIQTIVILGVDGPGVNDASLVVRGRTASAAEL